MYCVKRMTCSCVTPLYLLHVYQQTFLKVAPIYCRFCNVCKGFIIANGLYKRHISYTPPFYVSLISLAYSRYCQCVLDIFGGNKFRNPRLQDFKIPRFQNSKIPCYSAYLSNVLACRETMPAWGRTPRSPLSNAFTCCKPMQFVYHTLSNYKRWSKISKRLSSSTGTVVERYVQITYIYVRGVVVLLKHRMHYQISPLSQPKLKLSLAETPCSFRYWFKSRHFVKAITP